MKRVYNFAPGPSAIPLEVLETAQREMLDYQNSGMNVMEMSHRSKQYQAVFEEAESSLRSLMHIPQDYSVLFLQGGATAQFAAVPLNLTRKGRADYVDSGNFAHGALTEARKYTTVNIVASSAEEGYVRVPQTDPARFDPEADYFYLCTNNTIYGTRIPALPETGDVPIVADMSSNILSEVYDVQKFAVIFAGAQKNIGPAGLTVVIVRRSLLGHASPLCPKFTDWTIQTEKGSMLNTPPTYAVYIAGLCMKWLLSRGGVEAIEKVNLEKAEMLYTFLDGSSFFHPRAEKASRSRMNVTFTTPTPALDDEFVKAASAEGLVNLKGHRVIGGIRASIYNAMPPEGVKALIDFMKRFELSHR